jgi:hypothetical protein
MIMVEKGWVGILEASLVALDRIEDLAMGRRIEDLAMGRRIEDLVMVVDGAEDLSES